MLKKICCLFSLILSTALIAVLLWITVLLLRHGRVTLVEPNTRILQEETVMLAALISLNLVSAVAVWRLREVEARQGSEHEGSS